MSEKAKSVAIEDHLAQVKYWQDQVNYYQGLLATNINSMASMSATIQHLLKANQAKDEAINNQQAEIARLYATCHASLNEVPNDQAKPISN